MGRQPRLLSCHFCRLRKLRCNREFPCSNCTSRGVQCSAVNRPVQKHQPSQAASQTELLSRLEKVEALLAARVQKQQQSPSESSDASGVVIPATSTPPAHYQEKLPLKLQNLINDVANIDRSCFSMRIHDLAVDDNLVVRTCPIRLCVQCSANTAHTLKPSPSPQWLCTTKHIWLPNREDAEILIDKYLVEISQINNIVHAPSVRKLMAELYDHVWRGSTQVPVGSLILLLSILAMVSHLWPTDDDTMTPFLDYREAHAQTILWVKYAFDVIEGCRTKSDISIECVQGLIILSSTLVSLEGFSSRACSALSRAAAIARELGLHRLDHTTRSYVEGLPLIGVNAEIGRRVWWHLAATDWILASCSGPQRGTYSINPSHMVVTKPLNINDEDITEEGALPRPIEVPTSMSYSLQRLRLAEEFRGLVDRAPLIGLDPYAVGYDHILEADAAFERFLQSSPRLFSLGANTHDELPSIDPDTSHNIVFQRYVLTLFAYGQRCRLHLPYFVRGAVEEEYSHSRKVSLMSARIIIDAESRIRKDNFVFGFSRFKLGVVTFSYFMAVTIMVLDLCQINDENEKAIKLKEVERAWEILEEAQAQSSLISGGTETLKQVMKRHNIILSRQDMRSPLSMVPNTPPNDFRIEQNLATNADQYRGLRVPMPHNLGPQNGGLGSGIDANGIDWDNLMWVLEAPFL